MTTTTTTAGVAREDRGMGLGNARAEDCGGGLSRFAELRQTRSGLQKAPRARAGTRASPFSVNASTLPRTGGAVRRSGVVADKGGEGGSTDEDSDTGFA